MIASLQLLPEEGHYLNKLLYLVSKTQLFNKSISLCRTSVRNETGMKIELFGKDTRVHGQLIME